MTNNGKRRPAVFLDRDGTITEEVGYLNHLSRFQLYPFAAEAIRRLNQAGWPVIVVTNQSGVSRGFFPETLVREVHDLLISELAFAGAHVDGIYYCPHHSGIVCDCRKPLTGMLDRAAQDHSLAFDGSFVVSDRYADVQMGQSVGCHSILVLTGYGRGEYEWNRGKWPRQPDSVAENLLAATDLILRHR